MKNYSWKPVLEATAKKQLINDVTYPFKERKEYSYITEMDELLATRLTEKQARILADVLYKAYQLGRLQGQND